MVRLLEFHADYCVRLAEAMIAKAMGEDDLASKLYNEMRIEMGKKEIYFETCYDHTLLYYSLGPIFARRTNKEPIIALGN